MSLKLVYAHREQLQFQPRALMSLLAPRILQRLSGVLTQHPTEPPGIPGHMVEEATDGRG